MVLIIPVNSTPHQNIWFSSCCWKHVAVPYARISLYYGPKEGLHTYTHIKQPHAHSSDCYLSCKLVVVCMQAIRLFVGIVYWAAPTLQSHGHPALYRKTYTTSAPPLSLLFLSKTKCEKIQCVNAASNHRWCLAEWLTTFPVTRRAPGPVPSPCKCFLMIFIST